MSTLLNYLFGRLISADPESRTAKVSLVLSLVFHLGMLILFKYTGFFIENLNNWFSLSIPVPNFPLPIGISFYTFRAVSYIVDCYWGKVEAEQKFSRFLLYMTFFPVIMQGPIARYETMQNQLAVRRCNPSDLYEGMMRVIIGLGKKVIIADNLGNIVDQFLANGNIEQQTTLGAWYGVIVYAMQIYFDFSGYSDMAIGIARMMGFQLEENFRHPFLCKDITEFRQLLAMSSSGRVGCSSDQTTFRRRTPRFLSSRRITRASGHTRVSEISEMRKRLPSSLLPAPMALMIGTPAACACTASESLALTVSTASRI